MEPGTQVNEQEPSLRDSISASIEALDEPIKEPVKEPAAKVEPMKEPVKEPAAKVEPVKDAKQAKGPAAKQESVKLTDTPPKVTEKVAAAQRGPASWKPDVREKWTALPPEVQAEVVRREQEITRTLQDTAEDRRFAESIRQVAAPYQHYIALEGGDPVKAFGDYLKTSAMLRGGTPAEKATAVAQAVATFGVDVGMLDQALSAALQGRPMLQAQGQQPQYRDPRVDTLIGQLNQRQAEEERRLTEELTTEVIEFASKPENEFFEDLRQDISDLLRLAADRGQKMSLKDAYDKAAKLHPTVSKVVEQREQAAAQAKAKKDAEARRAAASSVSSRAPHQTGQKSSEAGDNIRDAIEASINQLQT